MTKKGESTPFTTYKYDDDGRRIEKTVNGQVTRFHYDGDSINVLYETDVNGTVLRQYVYNAIGTRLAMKTQGQTLYYHYNAHGDVIAMTDQNGQVVARYAYDAWGQIIQQSEQGLTVDNPFKYAGYMYDEETTMYYLMARYYQPKHGVFISIDPDPGDEDDPITQNGYVYADNNPVMMIDPDGNKSVFDGFLATVFTVAAYIVVKITAANTVVKNAVIKASSKILKAVKGKLPTKTATKNVIEISDSKMYQLGNHFNKHGRNMGYTSKKEYNEAAKQFAKTYQNKPNSKVFEGVWNGHGQLNGTVQRAIINNNKTVIIDKNTGQIIDFYQGAELKGLIHLKEIK